MTWPTVAVDSTDADSDLDSPLAFRQDVADLITKFNQLIAHASTLGQNLVAAATAADGRSLLAAAPLSSPAFTDTPTAPTAAPGTNTTQLATTAFVQAAKTQLIGVLHPVGSLYFSVISTNPGTLFGVGTWVAFGTGRTIVGIDGAQAEFNVVEETGGAKTHTLTTTEIPSHSHTYDRGYELTGQLYAAGTNNAPLQENSSQSTGSAGGGAAHNNLQPYIVIYMWKRTA